MALRGWFLYSVGPDVVDEWVGSDLGRARVVAATAPLGGAEPSPYARSLLVRFGDDKEVRGSLYGDLVSGCWTGPEYDGIPRQIERKIGRPPWREVGGQGVVIAVGAGS